MIAEVGDVHRFSNADVLARFAGIVPICFSWSGWSKDKSKRRLPSAE
ncbi:transposase [Paenibacillus sp. MMS20-IR301]